jgi:integrase
MPVLSLTEVSVRNLRPPPAGQVTYFDKQLRGFGCRVSASGVRAWVVVAGRNRARTTIGRYPTISLKEARKLAGELLAEHTLGKRRPPRLSFSAALDLYVDSLAQTTRESTKKGTERLLKNHFLPSLQHHQLADLQTHEITKITDRLMQRGQPGAANHAFAAMRSMLRFCVKRRLIPHSPLEGLGLPSRAKARERVLDGDELKAVWRAAETHGWPFGRIVQLLILTGARRQEIGSLRADYIADRVCTLPGDVTKNNREHIFPLGDLAADIIKNNPIQEGYLFPARGKRDRPFNGWSGLRRRF